MTPSPRTSGYDRARRAGGLLALVLVAILTVVLSSQPAQAQEAPVPPSVPTPGQPDDDASVTLELPDVEGDPSQRVLIIIGLTLLSVAPALLIMVTSFTRIVIVLTLTRDRKSTRLNSSH